MVNTLRRWIPKRAPSTTIVTMGQLLTSNVSLWLTDFPGSTTQPWTGAPTGTMLTVDLVHATTRQCVPPSRPRQRQQPLQTVEPSRTARSLGTATFQTPTIVENTGIASRGRENTKSAQMTQPQENQRFMTSYP